MSGPEDYDEQEALAEAKEVLLSLLLADALERACKTICWECDGRGTVMELHHEEQIGPGYSRHWQEQLTEPAPCPSCSEFRALAAKAKGNQ